MRSSAATGVRWYRRLGFRLALVMAVAMLAFGLLDSPIHQQILRLLGQPNPEEFHTLDTTWITEGLLLRATEEAEGRWRPTAEALARLDQELNSEGTAFAWLDTEHKVVAASERLRLDAGSPWPHDLETTQTIDLPDRSEPTAPAVCFPVSRRGRPAGTLVYVLADEQRYADHLGIALAELPTSSDNAFTFPHLVRTEEEYQRSLDWRRQINMVTSIIIVSVLVVLFSLLTSRLITRRLSSLAARASTPESAGYDIVPGPFPEHGGDEIAALARAMNSMRNRLSVLLENTSRRDSDRRSWIAQVSHDLRTPLTALIACLDRSELVLQHQDREKLKREIRKLVAVARLDALRVHTMADDLLEIARLDAADQLQLEPVPPGELARQTVRALEPLAEARDITVTTNIEPGLPTPRADGRRLMRALENLLRNAIDHASGQVRVLVRADREGLRFEVQDDGPGLPEADGEVYFSRLRGSASGSRRDSAGLGLVVTQRVAEAHNGRVGAHNLELGGAAVWFSLPVNPDDVSD